MIRKITWSFLVLILSLSFIAAAGADEAEKKPVAVTPEPIFEFKPVLDGEEVVHDFVIQNKGNAELKIEKVRTGWGCSTASYTKQIPAGGEGQIKIKVNTKNYGGKTLKKQILVSTSDPDHKELRLTIRGKVEKFISITPSRVRMVGEVGKEILSKVNIIPQPEHPLKVLEVKPKEDGNIRVEMETVEKDGKLEYLLTVVNLKEKKDRYYDALIVKTDSEARPEIIIPVLGNIFERPKSPKKKKAE